MYYRRTLNHRRRIYAEDKAKVVAAVWGTYKPFSSKENFEEKFLEEHSFWEGGGLMFCELEDHQIVPPSVHFSIHPFFHIFLFWINSSSMP